MKERWQLDIYFFRQIENCCFTCSLDLSMSHDFFQVKVFLTWKLPPTRRSHILYKKYLWTILKQRAESELLLYISDHILWKSFFFFRPSVSWLIVSWKNERYRDLYFSVYENIPVFSVWNSSLENISCLPITSILTTCKERLQNFFLLSLLPDKKGTKRNENCYLYYFISSKQCILPNEKQTF